MMKELLEEVQRKLYSAELEERQMYNYWCDCSDNFTTQQADDYQKRWDDVIDKTHSLKDLENALKKSMKYFE